MPIPINCAYAPCGQAKRISPSAVRSINFCDNKCRGLYLKEKYSGSGHPQYKGAEITIKCEQCGKERSDQRSQIVGSHHFCSKRCANKWNGERNRGEDNSRWLGGPKGEKARRALNPTNRLNDTMSEHIRAALAGGKAGRSWESLVGYRLEELIAHIESLFTEGMNWSNRGVSKRNGPRRWTIDHKRPQSSFSFTTPEDPEFTECWKLSNLEPLWGPDNSHKWAYWEGRPRPDGRRSRRQIENQTKSQVTSNA
jgi:hypothetical protein